MVHSHAMNRRAVLAAFDEQIRRNPRPGADAAVEVESRVVRVVARGQGWSGVVWSDLTGPDDETAQIIAAQVARFEQLDKPWEWKLYSYDRPADLPDRLRRAALVPEPVEALLVAEIAGLELEEPRLLHGAQLVRVVDGDGIAAMVQVHDQVFGGDHAGIGPRILAGIEQEPSAVEAVLAVIDGTAVSSGRVEFHPGTDFASLWGGGTLPAFRGHGLFRALVSYRAALARDRGYRYLQVDASPDSRPILERMGFQMLATTTPYVRPDRKSLESFPEATHVV